MLIPGRPSRLAATCRRHLPRYCITGVPMIRVTRSATAHRYHPTSPPRPSRVHAHPPFPCLRPTPSPPCPSRHPPLLPSLSPLLPSFCFLPPFLLLPSLHF